MLYCSNVRFYSFRNTVKPRYTYPHLTDFGQKQTGPLYTIFTGHDSIGRRFTQLYSSLTCLLKVTERIKSALVNKFKGNRSCSRYLQEQRLCAAKVASLE